jgi:hypothetical protein
MLWMSENWLVVKIELNLLFDMDTEEGSTNLEHNPKPDNKIGWNYKTPDLTSWSVCTSVWSTSSSNQDEEGNSRTGLSRNLEMSRVGRDTLFDKRPSNYGAWCEYNSLSSSSLMEQTTEGNCIGKLSETKETKETPTTRRATSYEFDRNPWNFGTRRSCKPAVNSRSIKQCSGSDECSERRCSSKLTRRATVTEFYRKPWNYGTWRDRISEASSTQLTRSSDSEWNL